MHTGIRLNLLSVSSKCLDSYLRIADSVFTFKKNHKFIYKYHICPSEDKKSIALEFEFNDNTDFLSKCSYVLSFYDSLPVRYFDVSHVVCNICARI